MFIPETVSNYIKSDDLQGRDVRVAISHVAEEEIGRDKERKFILYFSGKTKGMVLNATNRSTLVQAFGNESDNWRGRAVILYSTPVDFGGKTTMGLRIRIAKEPQHQAQPPIIAKDVPFAQPPVVQRQAGEDDDSEIPF